MVDLSAPPADAYDLVVASFVAGGYTVADGDRAAGLVKSAAIPGDVVTGTALGGLFVQTLQSEYFITATILPMAGGSRVALGATMRTTELYGRNDGTVSPEAAVQLCPEGSSDMLETCRQNQARLRARLESVAAVLRPE